MQFSFIKFEEELFPKWISQFKSGENIGDFSWKKGGPTSLYGCTDMLISKYIINDLEINEIQKDQWATIINKFQKENGWYSKTYTLHYKEHTTAYAIAALFLIDRNPKYSLKWKEKIINSKKDMINWTKSFNWSLIWPGSHIVSGVPAALAMSGEGNQEFFEWYFNWLNDEVDSNTGFWRRGLLHKIRKKPHFHDMAGAFHMYYIYEFFDKKWKYPKKIVDFTIKMQHDNGLWDKNITYCVDLDGLYSILRSSRNAYDYRQRDIKDVVIKYLKTAEKIFNDEKFFFNSYKNSHLLTGALSAIAECQKFYPQLVKTIRPWKQSLDKACFI